MRVYYADKIDDESSHIDSETFEARNDEAAKQTASSICRDKGWDSAEVWDKDADMFIAEVRA